MASGWVGTTVRDVGRLFSHGSGAGLGEGQLLERFVERGDHAALGALVERHGPMVLGVCRGILLDPNDVDDAFQATFLVLVRRAGGLKRHDELASWLYGVALRVARRSRGDSAKRRNRESSRPIETVEGGSAPPSPSDVEAAELRRALHDEIARLPESFRSVVVLCHLEGRSHEEAAKLLDVPVGTVKSRLVRARDLLRDRLARRGVAGASAGFAAILSSTAEAAAPAGLVASTISTAVGLTARPVAGIASGAFASSGAVRLMEGAIQAMSMSQIKLAASAVLTLGVAAGTGYAVVAAQGPAPAGKGAAAPTVSSSAARPPSAGSGSSSARPSSNDQALADLVPRAKAALQTLSRQYEAGQVSVDPLLRWSEVLLQSQVAAAKADDERAKAMEEAIARLAKLLEREKSLSAKEKTPRASETLVELALLELKLELARSTPAPKAGAGEGMMGGMPGGMGMMSGMMGGPGGASSKSAATKAMGAGGGERLEGGSGAGMGMMMGGMGGRGGMMMPGGGFGPEGGTMGMGGGAASARPKAGRYGPAGKLLQVEYRDSNPNDEKLNDAIRKKLDMVVDLEFPTETPFSDVIDYIKTVTKDKDGKTIPIYIDPRALEAVDRTMTTPIQISLQGVPLRTSLKLVLSQMELVYEVAEGVLVISNP